MLPFDVGASLSPFARLPSTGGLRLRGESAFVSWPQGYRRSDAGSCLNVFIIEYAHYGVAWRPVYIFPFVQLL